jgi:hypothetical protein
MHALFNSACLSRGTPAGRRGVNSKLSQSIYYAKNIAAAAAGRTP